MTTTRASLLIRVRKPDDSVAWSEFYELYSPLLYQYAKARGLSDSDADEIRSSCLATLVTHIREFKYDRSKGTFKSWLRRIVVNRVIDLQRKRRPLQLGDSDEAVLDQGGNPEEMFDEKWKLYHLKYCLEQVRGKVPSQTFGAFELLADDHSVDHVCQRLSMTANQVYKAKARILKLVGEEMRQVYGDEYG